MSNLSSLQEAGYRLLLEKCVAFALRPVGPSNAVHVCTSWMNGCTSQRTKEKYLTKTAKYDWAQPFAWWRHLTTTTRMLWGKLMYSVFFLLRRIACAWHKNYSKMHSGSCSQMTSSCKCPIEAWYVRYGRLGTTRTVWFHELKHVITFFYNTS